MSRSTAKMAVWKSTETASRWETICIFPSSLKYFVLYLNTIFEDLMYMYSIFNISTPLKPIFKFFFLVPILLRCTTQII